MKTSQKGIDLIKVFEGLRLKAYYPIKTEQYYTIGYGHSDKNIKEGDVITKEQAEELLKKDLAKFEAGVTELTKGVSLNQNQFDALVSFAFNCGLANLRRSTLLKYVRQAPKDERIYKEFNRWIYASNRPLEGLKRRRKAEANLYFSTNI